MTEATETKETPQRTLRKSIGSVDGQQKLAKKADYLR
jgi:hypothetical protein